MDEIIIIIDFLFLSINATHISVAANASKGVLEPVAKTVASNMMVHIR